MTHFEEVGVDAQLSCTNTVEAQQKLEWSCNACINKGTHKHCESCPIMDANKNMLELFNGGYKNEK